MLDPHTFAITALELLLTVPVNQHSTALDLLVEKAEEHPMGIDSELEESHPMYEKGYAAAIKIMREALDEHSTPL